MFHKLALALTLTLLGGCSLKGSSLPGAPIPFAEADYRVLGATNAEECGTYVLFIDWAHLFVNQGAAIGNRAGSDLDFLTFISPFGTVSTPEASRAFYHAIEKMPEATNLLEPRVKTQVNGIALGPFVMFGERCAQVEARGVAIGSGPLR